MWSILLLVACCYAVAAAAVHLIHRSRKGKRETGKHYVWVAEGRQPNMEWYVRSLYAYSRRTGEDVRLTIVDCGMAEETRIIAERLAFEGKALTFCGESVSNPAGVEASGARESIHSANRETQLGTQLETKDAVEDPIMEKKPQPARVIGAPHGSPANSRQVSGSLEETEPEQRQKGKRFLEGDSDTQLLWRLQSEGIITRADQTVLIDLQNPEDLSKLPF